VSLAPARLLKLAGRSLGRFFLRPDCPLSVVEVRSSSLAYARFTRHRGSLSLLSATALDLPEGALRPSLVDQNLVDRELVGRTLEKLLERLGPPKKGRLALVLPDPVARLRILSAEEIPARGRRREREELVRFRLRKGLPFDVREASITFGASGPGRAAPLLVAVMSSRVLAEYESLFESLGLHAGIVDLSGMALLGAVSAEAAGGDWLLVNWEESYVSFLLTRGGQVWLARTLDGPGAASARHVAAELASTVLYYRNRLGGQGLERAVVRCSGDPAAERLALLEEPLGRVAEPLDLGNVLPARLGEVELQRTLSGGAACLLGRAA
jgi:hypothetical protein